MNEEQLKEILAMIEHYGNERENLEYQRHVYGYDCKSDPDTAFEKIEQALRDLGVAK